MNVYHVKNLSKIYKNRVIFTDVTFIVPEGSIFCIYGKNGSGKSTLLRILYSVMQPDEGDITFNYSNNKTCLCTQFPEHLIYHRKLIDEIGSLTGDCKISEEILTELGLMEKKEIFPFHLSDGEKRLIFLYSYIRTKDLLLLDEPFANLDDESRTKFFNYVDRCSLKNRTIIYSSNRKKDKVFADNVYDLGSVIL